MEAEKAGSSSSDRQEINKANEDKGAKPGSNTASVAKSETNVSSASTSLSGGKTSATTSHINLNSRKDNAAKSKSSAKSAVRDTISQRREGGRSKELKSRMEEDMRKRVQAGPSSRGDEVKSMVSKSISVVLKSSSSSHQKNGKSGVGSSGMQSSSAKPSSFDITVSKLSSKTPANVKEALKWVRKRYIKERNGVERFQKAGGLPKLIKIIETADDEAVDLALSILGNCCMDDPVRKWVLQNEAIPVLVAVMKTSKVSSIQNRACRTLGNLSKDEHCAAAIMEDEPGSDEEHVLETIINFCKTCKVTECLQTYIRTIRLLSEADSHHKLMLQFEGLSRLGFLLSAKDDDVKSAALSAIKQLTHKLTEEHLRQIQISSVMKSLIGLTSSSSSVIRHLSKSLILQYVRDDRIRPVFGNSGGISYCMENLRDQPESTATMTLMHILCLCCHENVNRFKIKELKGLQLLLDTLRGEMYKKLHGQIICALFCFLHDEDAMELLLGNNLISVFLTHFRKLTKLDHFAGDSTMNSLNWVKVVENAPLKLRKTRVRDVCESSESFESVTKTTLSRDEAMQRRMAELGESNSVSDNVKNDHPRLKSESTVSQTDTDIVTVDSASLQHKVLKLVPGNLNDVNSSEAQVRMKQYEKNKHDELTKTDDENKSTDVGDDDIVICAYQALPAKSSDDASTSSAGVVFSNESCERIKVTLESGNNNDAGTEAVYSESGTSSDSPNDVNGEEERADNGNGAAVTSNDVAVVQAPKYSMDSPTYQAVCEWNLENQEMYRGPTNLRDSIMFYQMDSGEYVHSSPLHRVPGSPSSGSASPRYFYNEPLSPSAYGSLALYSPQPSSDESPVAPIVHPYDIIGSPLSSPVSPHSYSPPPSNPASPQKSCSTSSSVTYSPTSSPTRMSSYSSSSSLISGCSSPVGSAPSRLASPNSPRSPRISFSGLLSCDEDFLDEEQLEWSQVLSDDDSDEDLAVVVSCIIGDPVSESAAGVDETDKPDEVCYMKFYEKDGASSPGQSQPRLSLKRKGYDNGPESKKARLMKKVELSHRRKSTLDLDSLMSPYQGGLVDSNSTSKPSQEHRRQEKVLEHKILIVLCHVAERKDPTKIMVKRDIWACLCNYLLYSSDPYPRCVLIMNRLLDNKLCFESIVLHFLPIFLHFTLSDSYLVYVQAQLEILHGSSATSDPTASTSDSGHDSLHVEKSSETGSQKGFHTSTQASDDDERTQDSLSELKQAALENNGNRKESESRTDVDVSVTEKTCTDDSCGGDTGKLNDNDEQSSAVSRRLPACLSNSRIAHRKKMLSKVQSECYDRIVRISEEPYGLGVLAHILLRGNKDLRRRVAIVGSYILSSDYARKFIFVRHKGLDYLWDALADERNKPVQTLAALSILHLCQRMRWSTERSVESSTSSRKNGANQCADDICFVMDDGKELKANRETLTNSYPVFAAMLAGFYKESKQSKINIPKVRSDSFQLVLNHMLERDVQCETVENVEVLIDALSLAHQYMLPRLLQPISEALVMVMSMDTIHEIMTTSILCDCKWLSRQCIMFLFDAELTSADFLSRWRNFRENIHQTDVLRSMKAIFAEQLRENLSR